MRITYDKEYDILYVRLPRSKDVVLEEDDKNCNILYHYELGDNKCVGVTITNFAKNTTWDLPKISGGNK